MRCFEFIYIVEPKIYKNHIKKGILRFISDKLFLKIKIKPKIIGEITNSLTSVMGKVLGVFVTYENVNKNQYMNKIIDSINRFKTEDINRVVLDNMEILDKRDIDFIEQETGLKVVDGRKILVQFLPNVLEEFCNYLNVDLRNREILIISGENNKLTDILVTKLSKKIRFLTIVGRNENYIQNLSKKVFKDSGLSIFYAKNIDKTLKNYNIIVNLDDNAYINMSKLKNTSIVFDFSIEKVLAKNSKKIKNNVIIDDFLFKNLKDIDGSEYLSLNTEIPSYKYEILNLYNFNDLLGVKIEENSYLIKQLIDEKLKIRRKI